MTRITCARGDRRVAARVLLFAAMTSAALGARAPAHGCDLCAIYTTTEMRQDQTGFRLGVAEQFTYFGTLQNNGQEVANPDDEFLSSSVTQVFLGYNFHPRMGLQLNLPVIARDYRRIVTDGVQTGDTAGLGDMSLLFVAKPVSYVDLSRVAHIIGFAGVELPTGSTAFLAEEAKQPPCIPFPDPTSCNRRAHLERSVPLPPRLHPHHSGGPPSGIHGHDLTLGSGSVDGIMGAELFGSWDRLFATASVQYLMRSTGAYGYTFANDLMFAAGPGYYLLTGDALWGAPYALRAQVLLNGETKGVDSVDGTRVGDTAITALYLGPVLGFDWAEHLGSEFSAELPVLQNNSGLQIVPDYRLRAALTWRF
ncbi:MAG: hypothetical protein SF182_24005 [Deltaproteobacteria bacterium]|nr:hypothetical protein [Deltaproteobacteria bacterium]